MSHPVERFILTQVTLQPARLKLWVILLDWKNTPLRQSNHLKITENKEFLWVPPSRSVVAEECMRPGQTELQLQRGEQGVLPRSPRLNWYDGIPREHKCSENKDEVYTAGNSGAQIFSRQKSVPISWFKVQIVDFNSVLVRNPGQGHFWFPQYYMCKNHIRE